MGFEETVLSEKQLKERLGNDIIVGPQAKESLLFQAEITWKAGQEDCAKTHFKPDWEIKAQDIKDAEEEGFKAGRKEVVEWVEAQGKYEDVVVYPIFIYGEWEAKLKEWGLD